MHNRQLRSAFRKQRSDIYRPMCRMRRQADSQNKNKDCKTVIRKTVAVLEDEITELLNSVIQNPDLAGKEYISSKNETPIEIKRMENEIERALGQIDFDKETIQNLILQCASKRYEKEKSQKHITDRLKADFEKSSPLFQQNGDCRPSHEKRFSQPASEKRKYHWKGEKQRCQRKQ